jgi:hypothetical protein
MDLAEIADEGKHINESRASTMEKVAAVDPCDVLSVRAELFPGYFSLAASFLPLGKRRRSTPQFFSQ